MKKYILLYHYKKSGFEYPLRTFRKIWVHIPKLFSNSIIHVQTILYLKSASKIFFLCLFVCNNHKTIFTKKN